MEERQDVVSRLGWMLVFNPLEVQGAAPFILRRVTDRALRSLMVFTDLSCIDAMNVKLLKCWWI